MDSRLSKLSSARVLVIGDVILDRYWQGSARRISPEAPVPIVAVEHREERVGGAANVAANAAALGATVSLVGAVGADDAGMRLRELCRAAGIAPYFVEAAAHPTTVKLRVVSQHQQLVRLDFERVLPPGAAATIADTARELLSTHNVVVLSDYAKGALDAVGEIVHAARAAGRDVIVDPKGHDFARYVGATAVTPNLGEFEAIAGRCDDERTMVERARELCSRHAFGGMLITRGEAGMSWIPASGEALHLRAHSRDVYDVTGAGDTVCGVLATALGAGVDFAAAMQLANTAAGLVVERFGAATVTLEELTSALRAQDAVGRGILDLDQLLIERRRARQRGETVVMTNGCFDLLHEGHVRYLAAAKALGERLIVAVNDDASVRALKGVTRPYNALQSRLEILAALSVVDWVVPFSGATPQELIAHVLPDVLVKGGDYTLDTIAGAEAVRAAGGCVMTLPFHHGFSTTDLARRIGGRDDA
jgi:D-beta-D-heptose 7-phosphate kinase/D-beta-D-heptose 1-phosphate adenosyltransferase